MIVLLFYCFILFVFCLCLCGMRESWRTLGLYSRRIEYLDWDASCMNEYMILLSELQIRPTSNSSKSTTTTQKLKSFCKRLYLMVV